MKVFVFAPKYYHALIEKFKLIPFDSDNANENAPILLSRDFSKLVYRGLKYVAIDEMNRAATRSASFGLIVAPDKLDLLPENSTARVILLDTGLHDREVDGIIFTDLFDADGRPHSYSFLITKLRQIASTWNC